MSDGDREWEEREVLPSRARDVINLIRRHTCDHDDGYIHPCELEFDGTRVEGIALGRGPLDDQGEPSSDVEEIDYQIIAIVVDDDLREQLTPLDHTGEDEDDEETVDD